MNESTTKPPPPTFPPRCVDFFCESYFDFTHILTLCLIFIRFVLSAVIIICGVKIPKDFLKTITLGILIPNLIGALIVLYIELATFANEFQPIPSNFHSMFISWTDGLQYIVSDYIHFNTIALHILYLHCCKLAYSDDESILVFPTRMVVSISQSIPLFLCLLPFIPTSSADGFILRAIRALNKLYSFVSFLALFVMIVWIWELLLIVVLSGNSECEKKRCLLKVRTELPYDHARHSDMQVRDARSRMAFVLIYLVAPFLSLIPFFVDSILWLIILITGPTKNLLDITAQLDLRGVEIKTYSPIVLAVLTLILISPYRRAVLIIIRCKKIKVEPLPRKEVELTNMYMYANLEDAMEAT